MAAIKKLILLALTALVMVGCVYETEERNQVGGFDIIVVDSCEYLYKTTYAAHAGYGYLAHKGNCHFCKERREKEELVIKLKDK